MKSVTIILLSVLAFVVLFAANDWHSAQAYRVKSSTDPTFECSGCARTRLIGCFHGQCSYRCYRSCTNGTSVVIGKNLN